MSREINNQWIWKLINKIFSNWNKMESNNEKYRAELSITITTWKDVI